jgi:tetratricopeptide (TPR) repeat protein
MAKQRKKKTKEPHGGRAMPSVRQLAADVVIAQVYDAIEAEEWNEAQALLEDAVEDFPSNAEMHYLLGTCRLQLNQLHDAVRALERAVALRGAPPEAYFNLGSAYMVLGAIAAGSWALRQAVQRQMEMDRKMRQDAERIERNAEKVIDEFAARFGMDRETTGRALVAHDRGRVAVEGGDYAEGIPFIREAIRLAPHFVSPHNNLALAHFARGEYDQAIACLHHILDDIEPQNLHALGNMVRVLAAKGEREEAARYAERLAALPIADAAMAVKVAESFAALEDDQKVYDLLSWHRGWVVPADEATRQYFLGTAAANLGKAREAIKAYRASIKAGKKDGSLLYRIGRMEQALEAGQPLPRWSYFEEKMHRAARQQLDELIKVASRKGLSEEEYRAEIHRFATEHPLVVDAVSAMLYDEAKEIQEQTVNLLQTIGTEGAVNALRTFAFGKAGADGARIAALYALAELGQVSREEPSRIWANGKWQEVIPRSVFVVTERESPYPPEVHKRIVEGLKAGQRGDIAKAKRIWAQLIVEHPTVRDAYNNLAALLFNEGNEAQGEALLKKAIEVDPNYVFPRINLANIAIHRGDLKAAEEWLRPIGTMETIHEDEFAAYFRVSAMLHLERGDRKAAENALRQALDFNPDNAIAQDMLASLRGGGLFGRLRRLWK